MIRNLLGVLLCIFLSASFMVNAAEEPRAEQIVSAFQKLPHYELFCKDESWGSAEPIKVGAKFKSYLGQKFNRLFLWSQCVEPDSPPHYSGLDDFIYWDIRFGFGYTGITGEKSMLATNIRVQPANFRGPNKAIIKVLYDFGTLKNIVTIYTLIREDGKWKIDDIVPKGDFKEGSDEEPYLQFSKSIKTEMQNNYRKAEMRYQQEQAKKRAGPKL